MRINPVCAANYGLSKRTNNQPSFGAVFLNKATITDEKGQSKEVAIVELETEWRELRADLRLKHKRNISDEEFQRRVENEQAEQIDSSRELIEAPFESLGIFYSSVDYEMAKKESEKYSKLYLETLRDCKSETNYIETRVMDSMVWKSEEKIYSGDFELMKQLAEKSCYAADIYERTKERNLMTEDGGEITSMGKYLKAATNGKREVMPKGGYGMLKREYGEGVSYLPDATDSIIWRARFDTSCRRQRVLMAVEPQADGNYRNLSPDTEIYGMAEIYTDRLTDAVSEMVEERVDAEIERMEGIKKADKEFDALFQQYKDSGRKDNELGKKLNQMAQDICHKFNIVWGDFMGISRAAQEKGKGAYIVDDVPDYVARKIMEEVDLPEENARPVKIWRLFSTNSHFNGAEEALLDTIIKKAKTCGIFTNMWVSDAINHCKDIKVLPDWNGEKLFMEGFLKREKFCGIKIR